MPVNTLTYWNSNLFSNSTTTSSLTYQVPSQYWVSYGEPAQQFGIMPELGTKPASRPIKPEEPLEWLRRRVDEIVWVPA